MCFFLRAGCTNTAPCQIVLTVGCELRLFQGGLRTFNGSLAGGDIGARGIFLLVRIGK
ncbi:hypothetical protein D3C71_1949600 [compost metagenome]